MSDQDDCRVEFDLHGAVLVDRTSDLERDVRESSRILAGCRRVFVDFLECEIVMIAEREETSFERVPRCAR